MKTIRVVTKQHSTSALEIDKYYVIPAAYATEETVVDTLTPWEWARFKLILDEYGVPYAEQ